MLKYGSHAKNLTHKKKNTYEQAKYSTHFVNCMEYVLNCFLFFSIGFTSVLSLQPYSIAGPLKPSVIHFNVDDKNNQYAPTSLNINKETLNKAINTNGNMYSPNLQSAIDQLAGIETDVPYELTGANALGDVKVGVPFYKTSDDNGNVLVSNQYLTHNDVVSASAVGLVYASLWGPITWVSFTARSLKMRHWFAAIVCGTFVWFIITLVCMGALHLHILFTLLLCKMFSVGIGVFAFRKPFIGWFLGFFVASIVYAQFVSVFLFNSSTSTLLILYLCILIIQYISELYFEDITQSFVSSSIAAFISTACVSFLLMFFQIQQSSSFDLHAFVNLRFEDIKTLPGNKFLFLYWICLSLISSGIQIFRTYQGKTIAFPSIQKVLSNKFQDI